MPFPDKDTGYEDARKRLVRRLTDAGIIRSSAIRDAFLSVPRETFVPPDSPQAVYTDTTIPLNSSTGEWLTTSSQPTMMAIMLEQLAPEPGHRILEIGAGSGYNAALLAHITGGTGRVDSVEIETEAAQRAAESLGWAGCRVFVHTADGADGWPDTAPFDRIIATVAVSDIPDAWWVQGTKDVRIVAPLTIIGCDYSAAFTRDGGDLVSDSIEPCAFVRFTGRLAAETRRATVGDPGSPILSVSAESDMLPRPDQLLAWLEKGRGEPVHGLARQEAWDGLSLWLTGRSDGYRLIRAVSAGRGLGWRGPSIGVWDEDGMALATPDGRLESFGEGDSPQILHQCIADWRTAGAPGLGRLRLRLRPGKPEGPDWLQRRNHSIRVETLGPSGLPYHDEPD